MRIEIEGNLTRDPELRFTPSGQAVVQFGVACNRRWKDKGGEWQEETDFSPKCEAWGTLAENVAESLVKGSRVVLTGDLRQDRWQDKSGESRSSFKVLVREIGPSLRWATAEVQRNERRSQSAPSRPEFDANEEPF